jgi:hypothetical protein
MKKSLRIFNWIVKNGFIDPLDFFSITVDNYSISFLGHVNSKMIKKYADKKFRYGVDPNGYLEGKRGIVRIVLTD